MDLWVSCGYHLSSGRKSTAKAVFFLCLTNDVKPAQAVIDEPHNHRDDDDCDNPANEGINQT